jgi:hypothetical protein
MLTTLQTLPRNAELLAFEAGCEDYCEREVDEVQWQGGQVYLPRGCPPRQLPPTLGPHSRRRRAVGHHWPVPSLIRQECGQWSYVR